MHSLVDACTCPDGNQTCNLGAWGRHSNPLSSLSAQGHQAPVLSILVILLLFSFPWRLRCHLDRLPSYFSCLSFTNPLVTGQSQPYIPFMIQHLSQSSSITPGDVEDPANNHPPGPALLTSTLVTHPYCPSDHDLQLPGHHTPPVMLLRSASPSHFHGPTISHLGFCQQPLYGICFLPVLRHLNPPPHPGELVI